MSLSYVHGGGTTPLIGETIGAALERAARMHGTRTALVSRHQNIRWSYAELNERADTFATGLLALGLETGDRIGIWAPNCAEWTLTQFAAAKAGLILVNINTAYRKSELEYALNKVGCRVIVLAKEHRGIAYREMLEDLIVAATNQALSRVREQVNAEAQNLATNMGLPPGMDLPGIR